jgi:hypothetical protein
VIMATPLSTREIVWGKWWGTFAIIPRLAILPIWVAAGGAMVTDRGIALVLMIGLILAYSAAITSLGLALATWIPRLGRVITASVLAYVVVALGWPLLLQVLPGLPAFGMNPDQMQSTWDGLSLASPFFGIYATTEWAARWWSGTGLIVTGGFGPSLAHDDAFWPLFWIAVYSAIAWILAFATVRTFDRCLGRIPESGPA